MRKNTNNIGERPGKSDFSESKLAELLKGLTREEYKRFGLFIKSPYFNKSKTLEKMYDYFKPRMDKLDNPKITRASISQHIYPGETFDDTNVRKQISNFTKLIEGFLVQTVIERSPLERENLLIEGLYIRNYVKAAEQKIKEARKVYEESTEKNSDYYQCVYETERIYFALKSRGMKNPEEQISRASFAIDLYYISVKLLHFYTILNLRLHYNKQVQFDSWAFDDIVRFIERNRKELSERHKALYADYLSITMMLNPDQAAPFNELKSFIIANKSTFEADDKHRMYIYLYNHSLYRFNRGYSENPEEVFAVIKEMEDENVPLWRFFAYHMYYINAVKYSTMLNNFTWSDKFMQSRKENIQENIREETFSLAKANYFFSKKDFTNALKYLVNVDYPNYSFYLGAKTMLVKIYWELSETEGIFSTIEAMRKFLQRKELIPERLHESTTNFINCVSRMAEPDSKDREYEIKRILEKDMSATEKKWIRDKMNLV